MSERRSIEEGRVPPLAAAALLGGALLLALYWSLAGLLPRGQVEFAYYPFVFEQWPFDAMRGFTFEQGARHLGWTLVVGPGLLLLAFGLLRAGAEVAPLRPTRRVAVAAGALSVAVAAVIMIGVFAGRPITDDEDAYAWQASILAAGRLADADLPAIPHEPFSVRTALGWTTKYLPGEALVQIPGAWLGLPALLHLPLLGITLAAFFAAVRREADEAVAAAATTALALSPMVMATTATGLTHSTSLACMSVAGLGLVLARGDRPWSGAGLVAGAVGFGLLVRPQVAASFGGVVALMCAGSLLRRRRFGPLALACIVGGIALAAIGAYNRAITGSVTRLPWSVQAEPESWGFGPIAGSALWFGPTELVQNTISHLVRLNQWAFGSPLSLGVIGLWWALGRPRVGLATWGPPALGLVALMAGWFTPGVSDTGAVYWYEAVLPLALLAGHAWVGALERWPRAFGVALPMHLALATLPFTVEQGARLARLTEAVHGSIDRILASYPRPLLVIYEVRESEVLRVGWLQGLFPRVVHSGDVVYYGNLPLTQSGLPYLEVVASHHPGRACAHLRVDPQTGRWIGMPCEEALPWLSRPYEEQAPNYVPSTAMDLGWLVVRPPARPLRPADEAPGDL